MRIEKIELIGFKSFSEKTAFSFHPGITCIVGPNGSGKSNVVDSFRWVLGEQSAKSLRGEKMEEVIFNGSATKKPKGMSEVNLMLSFDSHEQGNGDSRTLTSVARRLYRSGDSEYLLNRKQCRLKDIKDLFLDTGLEVKSYSILEQGKIGEIVNSKPQDRRFLIEEVAGVMKYKVRKAEALSKLESSRLNLQRINDIVSEVKRQINSLDRQVKKAERFKKLSAEMRDIELRMAKRDYLGLQESLNKILEDYKALKEEEAMARAELNKSENLIETKRIGLLDKEKALDALISALQGLEREIAEAERAVAVATTESANLKEYLVKLDQQEADVLQRISGAEARKNELDSTEAGLDSEIDKLRNELTERNESIRSLESELADKEEFIESKRKEVFKIAEELSHLRNEAGRLMTLIESLEKKQESILRETEAAVNQLTETEAGLKDTDARLIGKNNELFIFNEKKRKITAEITEHRSKFEQIRNSISRVREEYASASSRLLSLKEIMHEDFSKDVIAENLHILASVSEIIDVDETYEKAIESALSGMINGFIIPSYDDISVAASALRQKGIGRTAFIPLEGVSLEAAGLSDGPAHDSVIARATDIVRVQGDKDRFQSVINVLLNSVYIVKDLSSAVSLLKDNRSTFVTMDGEIVEPSGAVIIGEGKGILKRRREIRELETLSEQKNNEISRLEGAMSGIESSLKEKEEVLKEIESTLINIEKDISLLRLTADNQSGEHEKIGRKLSYLNIERGEALKETESLKKTADEKEAETERINARKTEAEQAVSQMQDAIADSKNRYEAERASITELRLTLNSYKERLEAVKKERESSIEMVNELSGKKALLLEERANIDARIAQSMEDIGKNNGQLKGLVLNAGNLRTVLSDKREIIRSESEELINSEQELKAFRTKLDSLKSRISEEDVSIAEHRLRIENLTESIRLNYGLEIASFEAEPVLSEDEERLAEIRTKIQELGPVNLGTLDEYEELKTRYDFLTQQQEDLNKSIAELEEAITKINSTTRKKLRDAYEELNTKFSEVFTVLFGGGKAGLVLTDENNILDSGIEIIVQPPGKKLQNIHLLSGGEKALTALSLLFASFLIKPSPLCVLDEVDAPLDDSNIERFAKMLRELSSKIQFIVVTHNRVTMEAADYIYGITMEEPGISKVISMQFSESSELAA